MLTCNHKQVSSLKIDRQAVHLSAKGSKMGVAKSYNFDGAYDEETTQSDFFAEVGKPIVEEVLKGFNCTIFAYGQTGSGKTYTMFGNPLPKRLEATPSGSVLSSYPPPPVDKSQFNLNTAVTPHLLAA